MIPNILTPNTPEHDQLYKYSKSWILSSMGFIIIDLEIKRKKSRQKKEKRIPYKIRRLS